MQLLVIRPGAIGDTLLTFPVLNLLRQRYAQPHITLVGNRNVLPLARAFNVADAVLDYERVEWSELFLEGGVRSASMRELLRGVDRAICWLRDPDGVVERNLRTLGIEEITMAPGRPPGGRIIHEVSYLAETLELSLDFSAIAATRYTLPNTAGPSVSPAKHPIALHPGSSASTKCWPAAYFAAVIEHLWERGRPVLLLAGPADQAALEEVLNHLPPERGSLKVLADRPLLELARELARCALYLGNDSGVTHLAAMLGVPTIVLFGPTNPGIWRPPGPFVRVIQEHPLSRLPASVIIAMLDSFYA